jgi:hypothetical protein
MVDLPSPPWNRTVPVPPWTKKFVEPPAVIAAEPPDRRIVSLPAPTPTIEIDEPFAALPSTVSLAPESVMRVVV